jgi:DNA polymerase (family 10)
MENDQTDRLLKAVNNKQVKVMGHITCEEYGVRKPLAANWMRIFDECAKNNVKIEINGSDSRIFLSNELIQEAKKKGVKFTFGSDMHGIPNNMLMTSLWRAKRGGLTVNDFYQG